MFNRTCFKTPNTSLRGRFGFGPVQKYAPCQPHFARLVFEILNSGSSTSRGFATAPRLAFIFLGLLLISSCSKKGPLETAPEQKRPQKIRGVWFSPDSFEKNILGGTENLQNQLYEFGFNNLFIDLKGYNSATYWNDAAVLDLWNSSLEELENSNIETNLVFPIYWQCLDDSGCSPENAANPLEAFAGMRRAWNNPEYLSSDQELRYKLLSLPADRFILSHEGDYLPQFGPNPEAWTAFTQAFQSLGAFDHRDIYRYENLTREWKRRSLYDQWFGWRFQNLANQNSEIIKDTKRLSRGKEIGVVTSSIDNRYTEGGIHWSSKISELNPAISENVSIASVDMVFVECLTNLLTEEEAVEAGLNADASLSTRLDRANLIKDKSQNIVAILSAPLFAGDDLILSQEEKQRLLQAMAICESKAEGSVILDWEFVIINDFKLVENAR